MDKNHKSEDKKETLFKYIIIPFLFLVVIFHLLSGYLFPSKLWGIHHLYFYPFYLALIFTLLILSVFIPKVNQIWLSLFQRTFGWIGRFLSNFNRHLIFGGASFFSLFIFWFLRTRLYLFGDGYLKLKVLPLGRLGMAEWLNDLVHLQLFYFLSPRIDWWSPALTYASISVLCGGLFVLVVLYLSDLLGKNNFEKVFVGSLIFSLASLELFFGYVEAYTIFTLALVTFIFLSVLYLKGKISFLLPLGALILTSLFHVFGLVFVPSFLYLLWQDKKPGGKYLLKSSHLWSLISLVLVMILKAYQVFTFTSEFHKKMIILPLFPTPEYEFTMFCWDHFTEFFNQLLLISPVGIILFLFFIKDSFKSKDKITIFFLSGAIFSVVFVFVFNSLLGSADWDLRSFPGMFFVPLGAIMFISKATEWRGFKNYGLILVLVSFFHLIPWILLHVDERRSVEHYKLVQLHDPHPQDFTQYNAYKIARVLRMAGYGNEAEFVFKDAIKEYPQDMRNYSNLGLLLVELKRYSEAEELFKEAIKIKPDYATAHNNLGTLLYNMKRLDEAEKAYKEALRIDPDVAGTHYSLGNLLSDLKRFPEAEKEYKEAIRISPDDARAHYNLGILLFDLKRFAEAEKEYQEAIRLKPHYAEAYGNLGLFYLETGRKKEARRELERAKDLFKIQGGAEDVKRVEDVLKKLESE